MNPRFIQVVQALSIAALAWALLQLLNRLHPALAIGLVLATGLNVALLWLLRYDRDRFASLYSMPYAERYLNWVCHWAGDQPPRLSSASDPNSELLLHTDEDFRVAVWRAKQVVFGHDEVVDQLLWRVRDVVLLRKRRQENSGQPPLGSFLLVGNDGIGKRFLARVLAKLLLRSASVLAIECDKLNGTPLLGSPAFPSELLNSIRRQPFQLVLLEKIDAAPTGVLSELDSVLTRGTCRDPATGREVSFQNTIVILTATKAAERLGSLLQAGLTERTWHEQAVQTVCSETGVAPAQLRRIGSIFACRQPSDYVKAQVAAQLMLKECSAHGMELRHVDALVLAAEVLRIEESLGFEQLPQDIKTLMGKPILAAGQQNKRSLSLLVRVPSA